MLPRTNSPMNDRVTLYLNTDGGFSRAFVWDVNDPHVGHFDFNLNGVTLRVVYSGPCFAVTNPFANMGNFEPTDGPGATGTIELRTAFHGVEEWPGVVRSLRPGFGAAYMCREAAKHVLHNTVYPIAARPEVRPALEAWDIDRAGFDNVDGQVYYGGLNANEGGGHGIYPHVDWWCGCPDGALLALEVLLGYASRTGIWRYEPTEDLRFYEPMVAGFRGHDLSRAFALSGYATGATSSWNQLDGQHLGRAGHLAYYLSQFRGMGFAHHILGLLAQDVRLGLTKPLDPDIVEEKGTSGSSWWGINEHMRLGPRAQGSSFADRTLAHGMMVLQNAVDVGFTQFRDDRALCGSFLEHVYSSEKMLWNVVPAVDPITGAPDGGPTKRFRLPPYNMTGDIQKCREEQLLVHAVNEGRKSGYESGALMSQLRKVVTQLDVYPPEVRDVEDFSNSHGKALWFHMMRDPHMTLELPDGSRYDLPKEARKRPMDSANPCSAAHNELWGRR